MNVHQQVDCRARAGSFLSVYVCLLKGEHDEKLRWPIMGTLKIELYNWRDGKRNFSSDLFLSGDALCQMATGKPLLWGGGNPMFVSVSSLSHNPQQNSEYLKYNSLSFCIKRFLFSQPSPIPQLPAWTKTSLTHFVLTPFTENKEKKGVFYSPPFYTSSNGYKMCVHINTAGKGKGKDTHLSASATIMHGTNDGKLPWPFQGDVNITLINWIADKNHLQKKISFNNAALDGVVKRVMDSAVVFPPHNCSLEQFCELALLQGGNASVCYLKNNCLLFRVDSVVSFSPEPKPKARTILNGEYIAPYEFTVNEFSKRKQHKSEYYSKPFFTTDKGYKMQMRVGTNEKFLYFFVYLMRGKYDNNLEWPFRADIEVQLINWKNESKNHSKIISFSSKIPVTACSPVTQNNPCTGWGCADFLLLSELSTDFIQNDCLKFRVDKVHIYSTPLVKKLPQWHNRQFQYLEYNITGFTSHKLMKTNYISPAFYTHQYGYKMRLEVGCASNGSGFISLFARILKGEYDSTLTWPFTGNLLIELLNWRQDSNHCSYNIEFHERCKRDVSGQLVDREFAPLMYGTWKFLPEKDLPLNGNTEYIQNDCLRLRLKRLVSYSNIQKTPYWQNQRNSIYFEFTFSDFPRRIEMNNTFYSPPFYTSPQGYRICFKIYPNGDGTAKGHSVSLFACMLPGEYDDFLHWPFEGDVVIEVLNWREDKNHFQKVIQFNRDVPCQYTQKVDKEAIELPGWGEMKFMPHLTLFSPAHSSTNHKIFLEGNSHVRFRVREVTMYRTPLLSKTPGWENWLNSSSRNVCEFTLTGFSKHKEYKTDGFSPDFYTHKKGYEMRLEISPNGRANFVGKSLSLYVRLVKGEYDDSLKWPMNVEIPIEIVNWKRNSQHFLKTVRFGEASLACKSQVPVGENHASDSWGFVNFCPHETLLKHTRDIQYVQDDCLRFHVKQPIIHSRKGLF